LLFEREAAGQDHYRLIPDRRLRLTGFPVDESDVPVGLVFYVRQRDQTVIAHYPNPIGGTQCEVDSTVWQKISRRCPEVDGLVPTVEAVLVNSARGAREYWIVPIDDCYRLVALIRQKWRGLSGGTEVWPAIDGFFADLEAGPTRSR
jgi:predicted DCC family thiol-disulfide oxidoreductase YuxK